MAKNQVPDGLPVLSRGKHRSPRSGACFMEMASVLAGEKWSDQPQCTHPLLAGLARLVNDSISDTGRRGLVEHIPSVVGVQGDGLGWEVSLVAAVVTFVVSRDWCLSAATLLAGMPIGRLLSATEIAESIHFLASPAAGSIVGAVLVADGGNLLT